MDALGRGDVFLFEGFRLDPRGGGLFRRDERGTFVPVVISSRALGILGVLVERPGDLVSRDAIITAVWPTTVVEDNNLSTQIAALRRVLDQGRGEASCIQTVSGRGYRFLGPVSRVDPAPSSQSTPTSGNGGIGPIVENEQLHDPGFLGQIDAPPPAPALRARHRFRGTIAAALIGGLGLVVAVTVWNWQSPWFGEARLAPRLSIVVLPFTNLSNDREQQYFADGITEDLTTDLSRLLHMLVISRNTAFTYRNKAIDSKQIGRELGVRYLLEGSVQRSGNEVRVSVQLIDAATDTHLWAERFDHGIGDLFALQNEITGRIGNTLKLELMAAEAARPTEHPDALDYIFRGRALFFGKPLSRENSAEAISLFAHALALDPQSVEAQAYLAGVLVFRVVSSMTDSAAADLARAETLVDQALAASPLFWYAYYVKATVLRAQNRCEEAVPQFETALTLNRNSPGILQGLGWCKLYTGLIDEVIPLEEQAIRLSPRDPNLGYRYLLIGTVHLLQSRTDEAIVCLEKGRGGMPAISVFHSRLAAAYALRGESGRAAAELAEARRLDGDLYSSIAHLKASTIDDVKAGGSQVVPKIRALYEATYFAGLRKAGMPEE
jgi:TolB-like protein/DNA-binding winged helix-turn-helix (wHTH) protein/tetratricopeptide (TPR) repeat protein